MEISLQNTQPTGTPKLEVNASVTIEGESQKNSNISAMPAMDAHSQSNGKCDVLKRISPVGQQLQLCRPICKALKNLENMPQLVDVIATFYTSLCDAKECDCKDLAEQISAEIFPKHKNSALVSEGCSFYEPFSFQYNREKNETKVFCIVCMLYGNSKQGRKRSQNNSWTTGIVFKDQKRRKQDMKRHKESCTHKEAVEFMTFSNNEKAKCGKPTNKDNKQLSKML